jgi:competence ComEA-like helix-hairpin-helix protein
MGASFVVGLGIKLYSGSGALSSEELRRVSPDSTVYVSSDEDSSSAAAGDSVQQKPKYPRMFLKLNGIHINSATVEELVRLPGIGEAMAKRIVAYRNEHGPFKDVNGILSVRGIGRKKFDQIVRYISL